MLEVIGAILPLTLLVWFTPSRVMAATALLFSGRAQPVAGAYALGWVAGIALYVTVFTIFGAAVANITFPTPKGEAKVLDPVIALTMFALAGLTWRAHRRSRRNGPGSARTAKLIDRITPGAALALGLGLSLLSPLHLVVSAAVGADIAGGGLPVVGQLVVVVLFVVLSTSSITVPVGAAIVSPARAEVPLRRLQDWLTKYGSVVLVIAFLVIGVDFLAKSVAAFL